MNKIAVIFGTRPEAIKLCPLVLELRQRKECEVHVCVTGQHREMLTPVLELFGIQPDSDLQLMQPNQTLAGLSARAIAAIDEDLATSRPDAVIVQGDTTTAFCGALAAFYRRIPVGHVEAGLRTWNKDAPFPEEINRVLLSRVADLHFAPTVWARENLLQEGVSRERVLVTGNTVIDALHFSAEHIRRTPPALPAEIALLLQDDELQMVLVTGHRRENFGRPFLAICQAIRELARLFPRTHFVYPVHLNPNVREPVFALLSGVENIHLIEPLGYLPFVALMDRCTLVLTDSGGVQEEAPGLGKPVLVMRETTERPEAIEAGTARLTGTNKQTIVENVSQLLTDEAARQAMAQATNPYGDGKASQRIAAAMLA